MRRKRSSEDTKKELLKALYHEAWMSERQIREMFDDPDEFPIHESLLDMSQNKLVKRRKIRGQWKYSTNHLSEDRFDRIVLDVPRDAKNPPIWLYHRYDWRDLEPKILKEGLIPAKRRKKCYGSGSYVCDILDEHLPLRKDSVYFYAQDPEVDEYCPEMPWVKVRADHIPCVCKEVDIGITDKMHEIVWNKTVEKITQQALDDIGWKDTLDRLVENNEVVVVKDSGTSVEWIDKEGTPYWNWQERYWELEDDAMKEFKDKFKDIDQLGDGFKEKKRDWLNNLRVLDKKHAVKEEVMCPCAVPPEFVEKYCEKGMGRRPQLYTVRVR